MRQESVNIKQLLRDAGYKQTEIAKMLGVSSAAVHYVVTGVKRIPRIRKAISLATGRPESELWPDNKAAA
jgi:DNA-binding XRE family transcriptional regulator